MTLVRDHFVLAAVVFVGACANADRVDPNTHKIVFSSDNHCLGYYEEPEQEGECASNADCMVGCYHSCTKRDDGIPMCPPDMLDDCPVWFQEMAGVSCGCLERKCVWVMPIDVPILCTTHQECGYTAQCMTSGAFEGLCAPLCTDSEWTQYFDSDEMCRLGDPALDSIACEPTTGVCRL